MRARGTREAVRKHPNWDIWDKEDISRKARGLLREQQIRLVTTFFPERRFALLGDTSEGRWQTGEEFFAPYMAGRGAFTHDWPLVGRTAELRQLSAGLEDVKIKVILLTGPGGGGKSRLIKEAIGEYQAARKELIIRFLSPTQDATGESLDELGKGDKLLIVDDAHDRSDLPLLFQYIAASENNARLILSLRSYGRDYIKNQAANFTLAGGSIAEVVLPPLTLAQATELARQALERFSGPVTEAETIARYTRDCSLATVIGAQVVAADRRHFEMVKNEEVFRSTLLGRFQDIIAGRVGSKSETELVRKVLRVLALIQPFYPEDQTILQVVAAVEAVEPHDVSRLLRALTEAGVLFRRGGRYRLSPDLLADHIIEKACVGPGGVSTGYAEKVFAAAGERYFEHVLLNLGKLDWRLANGEPRNSRLLDGIWSQLAPSSDYGDPYIKAVTAVAYFQPDRALSFAEKLIRDGKYLRDLPQLIKYTAYTYKYTTRACECLWELGKKDSTNLDQNSNHAIRILADLCAVHPNKPIQFNQVIVDFGLSLLKREDAWKCRHSPFDILEGILRPEGDITESDGRRIILKKFGVNLEAVTTLRTKVVDAVIGALSHSNIRAATLAAQALREALRYPMDISIEARQKWTDDFRGTLTKVKHAIETKVIDPLVFVEIADAISWHANYGVAEVSTLARGILDFLPQSLEFRTLLTLVRGPASTLERYTDHQKHQDKLERHLARLTADLLRAYPDGEHLRRFIAEKITHVRAFSSKASFSPYELYQRLIAESRPLARATMEDALADVSSPTGIFAALALVKTMKDDRAEGITYIERFMNAGSADLRAAVANAFGLFWPQEPPLSPKELSIFRSLLGDNDTDVARRAASAARRVAGGDSRLAIEFFKIVDVGMSDQLADDVFMNFAAESGGLVAGLNGEDVDVFLRRLISLPKLDGWWIETFLAAVSEKFAIRVAHFFMDRVDHAAGAEDWDYRPCNYGPYGNVPLRFRSSPDFDFVLRQVSEWMKTGDDLLFRERSAQLFDTMFKPFDDLVVASLQRWSEAATETDIKAIGKILGEAPADFVFSQRDFVVRFVERARQFGKGAVDEAISNLFRSALGGVRSGTPGEPTPHDLAMKAEAEKAIAELPRFSPAFFLYESIAKHAVWSIDMSIRDGEAFED